MSNSSPYQRFANQELILRDQLAIDRTVLANERTLLAYIRTSLAMIAAGVTVVQLFEQRVYQFSGSVLIVIGAATALLGVRSYRRARYNLKLLEKNQSSNIPSP